MKAQLGKAVVVAFASFAVVSGLQAQEDTIFLNDSDPVLGFFSPADPTLEFGDEITPGLSDFRNSRGANAPVVLTSLKLEYFSSASIGEGVIRVYANDGQTFSGVADLTKPNSLLFTSPAFDLLSGGSTVVLDSVEVPVPDSKFTVTVKFDGLNAGQQVGLILRNPPSIGSSANDFWLSDGGGDWSVAQVPGATANFAFEIGAVPEPSTIALFLVGLGSLLGVRRWQKAKN